MERSEAAQKLLQSDVFQGVLKELHDECITQFCNSGPLEADRRERAYQEMNAFRSITTRLNKWAKE